MEGHALPHARTGKLYRYTGAYDNQGQIFIRPKIPIPVAPTIAGSGPTSTTPRPPNPPYNASIVRLSALPCEIASSVQATSGFGRFGKESGENRGRRKRRKIILFPGRRARVDQRAIRGKMEFFSELDWVQLFSPNIDLLGACSSHRNAKPPE